MSRLIRWWNLYFLFYEVVISLLAASLLLVWVTKLGGSVAVNSILNGNRSAIYGALASIFGTLLGFVITALSIIIGYSASEKFEFLKKQKHYSTLWDVLIKTIRALSWATVAMIIGLIFDRDSSPNNIIFCFCAYTALLSLLRLWSCIWVLENVIRIIITV